MTREIIEWCQIYWYDTSVENLPRVLLIGDSIVVGHRDRLSNIMKGEATIAAFSSSRIAGDPAFLRELKLALSDLPPDLVCFNNGLHGWTYDDDFYKTGLISVLDFLQDTLNVPILWRNSTPITVKEQPTELNPKTNPLVIRRNEIAAKVMTERNIPIIDMYTQMLNHPEYRCPDGVHYLAPGIEAQAQFMKVELEKYLPKK